jgi:Helix-turn-helix domain of resolvase.
MARPSKLTDAKCALVHTKYDAGVPVPKIAKLMRVSESSIYKVLDGSYKARHEPVVTAVVPDIHPRRRSSDREPSASVAQLALDAALAQQRLLQALSGTSLLVPRQAGHATSRKLTHAAALA